MKSSETNNDIIAPNSSDSAPLQDSTIFSCISDLSPIKSFKGEPVAQSFPGLTYSPLVFTSPRINPQSQSSSLERSQYHHLPSEYSKQNDDKNDDTAPVICTPGKLNTELSYQVDSHDLGNSNNGSAHGKGGITSLSVDDYLEADLLEVDCDDAGHVANASLKQSDTATPSSKDFAEYINFDTMNGEHHDGHVRTELQESTQLSQLHKCGGEPAGVISTEQNTVLHGSKVSQQLSGVPRRCLQYDERQQNTFAKNICTSSQSNAASDSRSFASESQVLKSSCEALYAPPNIMELENINKPKLSTFHAPKFGRSSLAVSKPSGFGLHLNSIVNALPMGCGASLKSADEDCMIVQGKKSFCTTDSHSTKSAGNSPTSSKAVDGLSVRTEEIERSCASAVATSGNLCPRSPKPINNPVLFKKPTEHHPTLCDKRKYTKLSPQKKRKRSTGISEGDGCKHCNCQKSKCLKLYCDCFASGVYCAQTCSCQGCLNSPEYEDTVLDTRQQIESRDPLAFVPKIVQHVAESPAINIQDINNSTPSSVRHKRGCNCKKSMCLKRYCECYQSNVGCSDGCRCDGCKNVYGKKAEYGLSKDNVITEATNDIPEISFYQKLDTILHSELSFPHNSTPFPPLFRYSDLGKDALNSRFSYGKCRQSPESDIAFSATHVKPLDSSKSSDNHKMIQETCPTIPDLISSDLQLYNCNSKRVDDFPPHRRGNNSLSTHRNPRSTAVASLMSQKTKVMTNDTSQPCPGSVSFSSLNSRQLCSSPITSVVPFGENKLPMVLDSDSRCYNISEDDDTPEILKEHPISEVKVRSPNKKRVSPPHSLLHELKSSSSISGLRSGRKFILKAVPSFPQLAPCNDVKSTSNPSTDALNSRNIK